MEAEDILEVMKKTIMSRAAWAHFGIFNEKRPSRHFAYMYTVLSFAKSFRGK